MDAAQIRETLHARAAALVARDAALQKHLRGEDGRLEADFSDRVAFTEMDEVLEALDTEALAELRAIRAALNRLEQGTYGTCSGCGETIPDGRLKAMPHAALCTPCAAALGG